MVYRRNVMSSISAFNCHSVLLMKGAIDEIVSFSVTPLPINAAAVEKLRFIAHFANLSLSLCYYPGRDSNPDRFMVNLML